MRYTAVFEFEEGTEPAVGKKDGWLGGELCAVLFSDGLAELVAIKKAAETVIAENAHSGDDIWWHLAELLGWEVGGDDAINGLGKKVGADKTANAEFSGRPKAGPLE
jgi:hypothetical protein